MIIKLEGTLARDGTGATSSVILCAGPHEGPLEPFETVFSRAVQEVEPTDADVKQLIPRGQRVARFPLRVVKSFGSVSAAENFCIQHENTLPYNARLRITSDPGSGGVVLFQGEMAEVQEVHCQRGGLSVLVNYQLVVTHFI